MALRTVNRAVTGRQTVDGAGVRLVRVLGPDTVKAFDPFLMLDAFDSLDPSDYTRGFPMHPHRGIETVTYLISGIMEHEDSLGNKGVIRDGDCQWMTAGQGILHQEMPKASPRMLGLQLWVNLPGTRKMAEPTYRNITASMLAVVESEEFRVRVLAGTYAGRTGPVKPDYVPVSFLDVELAPQVSWRLETNPDDTLFAYIFQGNCAFSPGGEIQDAKRAVLFASGETLFCAAGEAGARLALVSGPPLGEPVAWGGPIVMNTREELDQAGKELQDGTFIRH